MCGLSSSHGFEKAPVAETGQTLVEALAELAAFGRGGGRRVPLQAPSRLGCPAKPVFWLQTKTA